MGLFDKGKKAAKFTFISMPLSIFGTNQLKMGNQQIASLWKSIVNPTCPECNEGVLMIQKAEQETFEQTDDAFSPLRLYPWRCTKCQFAFLEEDNATKVREAVAKYRNEKIKQSLSTIEQQEIEAIANNHKLYSRTLFVASTLCLIGFFYLIATNASLLIACNWLAIGFALWVFGMKRSYRSWQVRTSHLFVDNAFWHWLKHEKWII